MVASIFSSSSLQENTIIVFPKCQTVPLSGFYLKCRFNLDQNTTNTGNERHFKRLPLALQEVSPTPLDPAS